MKCKYKEMASQKMAQLGYLTTDYQALRVSEKTFSDGSHYSIGVIAFNCADDINSFLRLANQSGVSPNRLSCTKGAFFLEDEEIQIMLDLCHNQHIELSMGLSCRAEFDHKSSFRQSPYGLVQARRLDNLDAITRTVEEVYRLEALGVKTIIIYDVGVLYLLKQLRDKGCFKNIVFTLSSHNNCANYLIAKTFEELGANFVVLPPNVQLPMLNMIRTTCPKLTPLVSIDTYSERGGFIRINEAPLIVSTASPVMLKFGASVRTGPYANISEKDMLTIIKTIRATVSVIEKETDFKQKGVVIGK